MEDPSPTVEAHVPPCPFLIFYLITFRDDSIVLAIGLIGLSITSLLQHLASLTEFYPTPCHQGSEQLGSFHLIQRLCLH